MKARYIKPVALVVLYGCEDGYSIDDLVVGTKFEGGEDDILVKDEGDIDLWSGNDDSWGGSGGNIWDNAW